MYYFSNFEYFKYVKDNNEWAKARHFQWEALLFYDVPSDDTSLNQQVPATKSSRKGKTTKEGQREFSTQGNHTDDFTVLQEQWSLCSDY